MSASEEQLPEEIHVMVVIWGKGRREVVVPRAMFEDTSMIGSFMARMLAEVDGRPREDVRLPSESNG